MDARRLLLNCTICGKPAECRIEHGMHIVGCFEMHPLNITDENDIPMESDTAQATGMAKKTEEEAWESWEEWRNLFKVEDFFDFL